MSNRDAIRSALLGSAHRRKLVVQVAGLDVELRAPSLAERDRILESAQMKDGRPTKLADTVVEALLACAFDAKSGAKVFEPGDRAALMDSDPALLDELFSKVSELLHVKQEAAEEISKN